MEKLSFTVADYAVFSVCLLVSTAIGLRYAFTGGKQKTTDEFFMANRKMRYGPVALSLMVSFISAVTVLGVPAEVYINGTGYCFLVFSYFICFPVVAHIFIPVFYKLHLTSVYEYLELRFSKLLRICGTITYMLMLVIYMGVALYTPALALNTVTNINVWTSVIILSLACTFYTAIGGLKAVIWTDVFQAIVMIGGQIVVIVLGVVKVGGLKSVLEVNYNAGKISPFVFDPSPFEKHTFWTLTIGGAFMCMTLYGTSQTAVQRYLSCHSEKHAIATVYLNIPLLIVVMVISAFLGLTMYATYHCNNPLASGVISKPDQLLIYYVMDLLRGYSGLPGLFVASLFSAALSTISSCFNVLATLTMQDLIKPYVDITDEKATLWSKFLALGYGVLCLIMSIVASSMGSVLIAAISIFGIIGGPLLGLFILGMFFRSANGTGALAGCISSLIFIVIIGFGSIAYHILEAPPRIYTLTDETCRGNLSDAVYGGIPAVENNSVHAPWDSTPNASFPLENTDATLTEPIKLYSGASFIFRLSYMWYSGASVAVVLIVGLPVSFATGGGQWPVSEVTLHPMVRKRQSSPKPEVSHQPFRFNNKENHYVPSFELHKIMGPDVASPPEHCVVPCEVKEDCG